MINKLSNKPRYIDFSVTDGLRVDNWLLTSSIMIMCFSILIVFSAGDENTSMITSHIMRNAIALCVFVFASRVQVTYFMQLSMKFYILVILMLILVAFVGDLRMGARRWLDLGFISFQPSELAKLAVPMACSLFVSRYGMFNTWKNVIYGLVVIAVPFVLVLRQPDLGTSLMIAGSGFAVMLFAGLPMRLILGAGGCITALAPYLWSSVLKPYQKERVLSAFNPELDPLGSGYHVIQAKAAIGSGGLDGSGWLNGTQTHLGFIPEQHTDFIFAVIGEEFGFMGFMILMGLYALLLGRLVYLVFKLTDLYGKCFAASVASIFFAYYFVNIGMVSGILPVVGVPLPLVSYGGTATVSLMFSVGIVSAYATQSTRNI